MLHRARRARRPLPARLLHGALFAAAASWAAGCAPGQAVDDGMVARLKHVPPMVRDSVMHGPLDGNDTMNLRLALPLHHEDELDALIADIYNPHSPRFGHYITPAAFAGRYLPDVNDVAAVRAALAQRHLDVARGRRAGGHRHHPGQLHRRRRHGI